ncbi:hypothetical protein GCM10027169_18860 [Gordonia jinhuaensis]|uniref:Uncharacterized protein n=1 Tax=Gordonia jinhuaensis TaxID=1517702 RepID=A0A916TII1_9ACTN|nr:hypothetical protein GCM10011489_36810 [Gordonia jinhuaensis]
MFGNESAYGECSPSIVAVTVDRSFVELTFNGSSSDNCGDALAETVVVVSAPVTPDDALPLELDEHPPTSITTATTTPDTSTHGFAPITNKHRTQHDKRLP